MLTIEENLTLAELLFPHVTETREDLERQYPPRDGFATRIAPSPTGFLHIGAIYQCFLHDYFARTQPRGRFILRIEDTDAEREVEGAVDLMINGIKRF